MNPLGALNIRLMLATAAGVLLIGSFQTAEAQSRYRPPAGPTLPGQLNYFRRDVGLLDQYNTFVQPQRQLEAQLAYMQQQQQADYRNTQRQLEQIKEIRASEAAPTGVGSGFQNYSHYYRSPVSRTRLR